MSNELYLESPTQWRYKPDTSPMDQIVYCGVCGDKTVVRRGVKGPRSYAAALGRLPSTYDEYTCPNYLDLWHQQVIALRVQLQREASNVIRKILQDEISQILETKQATISSSDLKTILLYAR